MDAQLILDIFDRVNSGTLCKSFAQALAREIYLLIEKEIEDRQLDINDHKIVFDLENPMYFEIQSREFLDENPEYQPKRRLNVVFEHIQDAPLENSNS